MTRVDVAHTRGWVGDLVRSGLNTPDQVYVDARAVIAADHPDLDADATAREWIDAAARQWRADAAAWPDPTDFDRLQQAFAGLEARGIAVLQGCADHWAAKARLEASPARGVAWFTAADVWHAIDEAMLEVNLWHGTTANAAPGDPLLDEALAVFEAAGLDARFDEGRIEVAARWQRRPGA